jgi:hypothetical protein
MEQIMLEGAIIGVALLLAYEAFKKIRAKFFR